MAMNVFLLSALAFVSADAYLELPIFRKSGNVTVSAIDGSTGVTFSRESLCANISINSVAYTTHLEPEFGDVWIFEDQSSQANTTLSPTEQNQSEDGLKRDIGMYDVDQVQFDQASVMIPYVVFNMKLAKNYARLGGLGLGPTNSSTFELPMLNGEKRESYPNFAERIKKKGYTQSLAFTINLATDPSNEDKLVYGAMDLSRFTGKLKALRKSPSTNRIDAKFTIYGIRTNALLEIDDPNSYLEDEVVAAIASKFGAVWDENHRLYTISSMPQNNLVLKFGGVEIEVPPADVWVQDKQDNEKWYLTIRPLSSYTLIARAATIGADILKSAYIVYDLKHNRAAIGKAVRNPGPANYEVIPTKGIPKKYFS